MAKKADLYYYETFAKCADCACRASQILEDMINDYKPEELPAKMEEIHAIEHEGDELNHGVMEALIKAFITPIEREDILDISNHLDDIIDTIEDVVLNLYMYNVKTIRPEAATFMNLIKRSCELVKSSVTELANFKKSKRLKSDIIEVNQLEEEGDRLYIESMHKLHTSQGDPIEIVAWREVLKVFERCLDTCEKTAGLIEGVVMKNS